ncbi:M15 family metallopeptidase [Prochlorococcus marinus]|uniref:Putative carboxypeptidase n=1 Tax=Prochlorococcus marinus (strain MIT 9211) TaxID=93059 RepID=A9BAS1_PROM4|nr:M15 family metallopeptidase [Prochlorococcus marinus]ABX08933.1 putative carboxypeptidase [Prochlorococcus marinus str. MIT 9211]
MTRAQPARNKNFDEIPLAQRSKAVRTNDLITRKIVFTTFLLVGTFTLFFGTNLLSIRDYFYKQIGLERQIDDDRLLGHYPYPEAISEDLRTIYPGLQVHKDTYTALLNMRAAAERDGIYLIFLSGYRSIDLQKEIFYDNKSLRNQVAVERARVSAPPGYSEHSTGYAIDIGDATMRYTDFEVEFEQTPAFRWLQENAARYHFILSFPKGNSQKVSYEPWHWRFEGTVEALEQFKKANQQLFSEISNID